MDLDVAQLGQVFTPPNVVAFMLDLCRNKGRVLEPSAGDGAFFDTLRQRGAEVVGIEIDQGVAPQGAQVGDFFAYPLDEQFDTIVSIGLLMFFDCATAQRMLARLEDHLRPGGTLIVNVLVEGTTYMEMFDPQGHCLFERDALARRFAGWDVLLSSHADFPAPGGLLKSFATVIARKPAP